MSIFDIFGFKKEAKKIFSKETILEILNAIKNYVIKMAKESIPGPEKKELVDRAVIDFINFKVQQLKIKNKLVLWLVDRFIEFIPKITQLVYDFLKEKVENL